jgi:hypothetical protein
MARGSSRTGKILLDASAGAAAAATPLSFIGSWSIDAAQPDFVDVTALGDTTKQYVQGLVDNFTVTMDGFYNLSSTASFTQIADASARKTYVYPDFTNQVGTYWFGTVAYGGNVTGGVSDAIKATLSGRCTSAGAWVVG